jgi:hypothetical protein
VKPATLTPRRALDLIFVSHDHGWSEATRLERIRGALREHVNAALARKSRRRARKAKP